MIELTTTVLFLLGTFYGDSAVAEASKKAISPEQVTNPVTLEEYVRDYFADEPIMAEIAKCESRFKHLGRNGKVIRGELTPDDVGVMQINEYFHLATAKKLGIDLHTLDGNLAYAKWLYTKEGTTPWNSSGKCWQKSDRIAQATVKSNLD